MKYNILQTKLERRNQNNLGKECGTNGEQNECIQNCWWKFQKKKQEQQKKLIIGERIILKWIL
jgi:hypothetical protein